MAHKKQVVQSKLKKDLAYISLRIIEDHPDQLCLRLAGEVTWSGLDGMRIRDKIRAIMDVLSGAQIA